MAAKRGGSRVWVAVTIAVVVLAGAPIAAGAAPPPGASGTAAVPAPPTPDSSSSALPAAPFQVDPSAIQSMPADPAPQTLRQPDGGAVTAIHKGNAAASWYDTTDDYALAKDATGTWSYAKGVDAAGDLVPSGLRPDKGAVSPASKDLRPIADPSPKTPGQFGAAGEPNAAPPFHHAGVEHSLVILASFSDKGPSSTVADWTSRFFGATGSLRDFYHVASYNALDIQPAADTSGPSDGVVGWVNLGIPHPDLSVPKIDQSNAVVLAALNVADPFVNFAQYDTNGVAGIQSDELHITVIMAGKESSFSEDCPGNGEWGHETRFSQSPHVDGVTVSSYTTFGEMHCTSVGDQHPATIGIIAHEMGHDLGWPDLYDVDGGSNGGVGTWSLMAAGSWNTAAGGFDGNSPALPDAFAKSMQGWVTPTQMTSGSAQVTTGATTPDVRRLLANPNGVDWSFGGGSGTGEYFLVENRQKVSYDAGLPGCGLLIWHIDEAADTSRPNADDTDRLVDLEQADGNFDLNGTSNRGDAGDPWPGTSQRTTFGPATTPNSSFHSGAASGVSLVVTSTACAPTMSFTVGGGPANDVFSNSTPVNPTSTTAGSTVGATVRTGRGRGRVEPRWQLDLVQRHGAERRVADRRHRRQRVRHVARCVHREHGRGADDEGRERRRRLAGQPTEQPRPRGCRGRRHLSHRRRRVPQRAGCDLGGRGDAPRGVLGLGARVATE